MLSFLSLIHPFSQTFPFFLSCLAVSLSVCFSRCVGKQSDASGLAVSKGGGHFLPKFPLYLPFSWIPHRWFLSWQFAFLCSDICAERNTVNNIFISREQLINLRLSLQIHISFNSEFINSLSLVVVNHSVISSQLMKGIVYTKMKIVSLIKN